MKRSLLLLPLLSVFPGCTVGHMVGENQQNQGAISCATTLCNGATVCVDSQCVEPTGTCGGFAGLQCPAGERCVDNPRDNCDPTNGGADCSGVCVAAPSTGQPDAGTTPDAGTQSIFCGGIASIQCPSGLVCVDDPNDGCDPQHGGADCGGVCAADPNIIKQCGGHVINPQFCAVGELCIDNPTTGSMEVDHPGICIKKVFCGGFASIACPTGLDCIDDPDDSCDPQNGGADCGGVCVLTKSSPQCGGFAGFGCPGKLRCLDNPADDCDPNMGDADCMGLCVP